MDVSNITTFIVDSDNVTLGFVDSSKSSKVLVDSGIVTLGFKYIHHPFSAFRYGCTSYGSLLNAWQICNESLGYTGL